MSNSPHILLIDDEEKIRQLYSRKLALAGFRVTAVEEGWKGLVIAKQEQPDAILLDILMPASDGVETLSALKRDPRTKEIPVIFIAALDDHAENIEAAKLPKLVRAIQNTVHLTT